MFESDELKVSLETYGLENGGGAEVKAAPEKTQKGNNKKQKKKSKNEKKVEKKKEPEPEVERTISVEDAFKLVRSVGEECQTDKELTNLITKKPSFRLYDGFEPSGRMHIAQGVFKAINVNKCTKAGGTFVFWVADWFALMNDKMGGDLDKIKTVGLYLIEVWKAAGMDMSKVEFRWASDDITNNADKYWTKMLDITRRFTLARIKKCCQIMGRLENRLTAAQILYPLMQCTDIFFLRADICQLGVDQRKVNMLARDYCDAAGIKLKPIILSHHMLYGLKEGQAKMSKSDPDSAIFMEDTAEDVVRKMSNAYCPTKAKTDEGEVNPLSEGMSLVKDDLKNPCLDYAQYIIFAKPDAVLTVGGTTYTKFADLKEALVSGVVSENDLKSALTVAINTMLEPVRDHFTNDDNARKLFEAVRQYKRESKEAKPAAAGSVKKAVRLEPREEVLSAQRSYAVFAPAPESHGYLPLGTVLSIAEQIKQVPAGSKCFLWLPDLSALARNSFGADKKTQPLKIIRAFYTLLADALFAFLPEEVAANVTIEWQSEAMLRDPSNYWISVINAGRHFQLETIVEALSKSLGGELLYAGEVVEALLHIANVLGSGASVILCSEDTQPWHELAVKYMRELPQGSTADYFGQASAPTIQVVPAISTTLKNMNVYSVEGELCLLDSPAAGEVKRKLKRAFCEPGNVEYNPVLDLSVNVTMKMYGSVSISRSEENGGNVEYTSKDALVADFKSEALHPGDLKQSLQKTFAQVYKTLGDKLKSRKKESKALTAYRKKAAKNK